MYTGLRIKVTVKEEYRAMISAINGGAAWKDYSEQFPLLAAYASLEAAEYIPRGTSSYMPESWTSNVATEGFERSINMDTGNWSFQCSLKNIEGEIQLFFSEVLPNIISDAEHIEYRYEESSKSQYYDFVDGTIKIREMLDSEETEYSYQGGWGI